MKRAWMSHLVAPGRGGDPLELDPVRLAEDEVIEGFLVSRGGREVWPLVAGVAVLPRDLRAHLRAQGNVYRRSPINDPRVARFVLGDAGTGYVVVPFDEVVAQYRDLAAEPPEGYDTTPHPGHVALGTLARDLGCAGRGLVVGAGVGRGVFTLCATLDAVLGVDRSIAVVRRARNIAVTVEDFVLPAPKGSGLKEVALDLGALAREGADFALADPDALPLQDASLDLVVLHAGDAEGPWSDPAAAWAEAWRVARPGGHVVFDAALQLPERPEAEHAAGPWRAVART